MHPRRINRKELRTMTEKKQERKITVNLTDTDCNGLIRLCGNHGLTVSELIENFIEDLVGGTHSNGSDERMYARQYFERCGFGMFPEKNLLKFLSSDWYVNIDEFIDLLEQIEDIINALEDYEKNPEVYDEEEIEYAKNDLEEYEKELSEIKADFFKNNKKADWEKEVHDVKEWWEIMEKFINA